MSYLELTSEEKMELERRGFIAKNIIDRFTIFLFEIKIALLITIIIVSNSAIIYILVYITMIGTSIFWYILGFVIFFNLWILMDLKKMYHSINSSIKLGTIFYGKEDIIGFQENYKRDNKQMMTLLYEKTNDIIISDQNKKLANYRGFGFALFIISIILYSLYLSYQGPSLIFPKEYGIYFALLIVGSIAIIYGIIYITKINFYSSHPLYSFGNLGHKIQSLTPRIDEQSKQIESEFRGDMDFRVLSQAFDALASAFSQIVSLVMRLEKAEKRANKGDLFDSTKYINSLRADIRTPLLSLKNFLERQRVELQSSQQELMKVRVSVGGESENRELQSIRGNELLRELDENIVKIGEMIERL